jgi:hypothetical protein
MKFAAMVTITPHLASVVALTTGIGVVMSCLGLRAGLLRARLNLRQCPSCGVQLSTRTCRKCKRF